MKILRKPIAFIACLLSITAYSTAQEIGLDATTKMSVENSDSVIYSFGERLDGWWKLPLDDNGSVFEGSAHAGIAYSDSALEATGDLDQLRVAFVFPTPLPEMNSMNLEFGRLGVRDPTGLIVSHPADGALAGFDYKFMKIGLQAGFTTLILRNSNNISISLFDQSAAVDDSRILGNSRLLILTQLNFPSVFAQSVNISFLAQQDMNPDSAFIPEWTTSDNAVLNKGGKLDTQYTTLKVTGPVIPNLFYDLWFTYGSGRTLSSLPDESLSTPGNSWQYTPISSFMSGLSFDYYKPSMLGSAFNFRFLYASGDSDYSGSTEGNTSGDANQFIPLTGSSLGTAFSPKLSNLIVTEFGGSLKPLSSETLQTGLKLFAFFRPTDGPLDVSGLKAGESSSWLGFEADIFGNYRIRSDLGISLNTGIFFPGVSPDGAFDSSIEPVKYSVQLALTLGI